MLYLAPMKYYNSKGQILFYKIVSDLMEGNITFEQLGHIENNLRLLKPKDYYYLLRYLHKHPLTIKEDK